MAVGFFDQTSGETMGDARKRLAMSLLAGQQQAPKNLGEGLNDLGRTLMGAMIYRQQMADSAAADASVIATLGGQPYTAPQPEKSLFDKLMGAIGFGGDQASPQPPSSDAGASSSASGAYGGAPSTSGDKVDPNAARSMFMEEARRQGLVGYVPPDGVKYGIRTGSADEWGNYFTGLAAHESGLRNSDVGDQGQFDGGSRGLLQLSYADAPNYGLNGGRPFTAQQLADPRQNAAAGVAITKQLLDRHGTIQNGPGRYWGPISREGWTPGNGRDRGLPWGSWRTGDAGAAIDGAMGAPAGLPKGVQVASSDPSFIPREIAQALQNQAEAGPVQQRSPEEIQAAAGQYDRGQSQRFRPMPSEQAPIDPRVVAAISPQQGYASFAQGAGAPSLDPSSGPMPVPRPDPTGSTGGPQPLPASIGGIGATPMPQPRPDPSAASASPSAALPPGRVQLPDGRVATMAGNGLAIADGDNSGRYVSVGASGGAKASLVDALLGRSSAPSAPSTAPQAVPVGSGLPQAPQAPAGGAGDAGAPSMPQTVAQQGAMSPRIQALMAAVSNPNASPQVRAMAAQALQLEMQPQYDFVTRPDGSIVAVNKRNPTQSIVAQGPMRNPTWGVIEETADGRKVYGWTNPVEQTVRPGPQSGSSVPPANPSAAQPAPGAAPVSGAPTAGPTASPTAQPQPSPSPAPQASAAPAAPLPQPSSPRSDSAQTMTVPRVTGEDYLDGISKDPQWGPYASQARAILRGDAPVPTGNAATKGVDQMIMRLVYAADPNFNASVAASRGAAIKDYQNGDNPQSAGGQIIAANTALGHLRELAEASEALGKTNYLGGGSSWVNWAQDHLSSANSEHQQARTRFNAAATPLVEELTKFYSGSSGTEGQRAALMKVLEEDASPEQRREAIGVLARDLNAKADELQRKWHQSMGPGSADFPILGPAAQSSLGYINGLSPQRQPAQEVGPSQYPANMGGAPSAPPKPGNYRYNAATGKLEPVQ